MLYGSHRRDILDDDDFEDSFFPTNFQLDEDTVSTEDNHGLSSLSVPTFCIDHLFVHVFE